MTGLIAGTTLNGETQVEQLTVRMDVVSLNIPLLMSKASLKSTHATLNFEKEFTLINNRLKVPLINTPGGHILFKWDPNAVKVNANGLGDVHVAEEAQSTLSAADILRIHIHLGHAETSTSMRIFKLAGKSIDGMEVERALLPCKCERMGAYPQNPVVSKYLPDTPGKTVFFGCVLP